ncbi:MAG: hypothetical protein JSS80_12165 [Bacteroidetes bacterium]|nr:hypothetical protein [Bacteroidota bacterium]
MSSDDCKFIKSLEDIKALVDKPSKFRRQIRFLQEIINISNHLDEVQKEPFFQHCNEAYNEENPGLTLIDLIGYIKLKLFDYSSEYNMPTGSPRLIRQVGQYGEKRRW